MIDLHHCDWRDLDAMPDALICDPPYGPKTHKGHDVGTETGGGRRVITYAPWTADEVSAFVLHWAPRTAGWMACFCSHDLIDAYTEAYEACGRYAFAPVSVIQKRPRLLGDGPASWTLYLMTSRPASRAWQKWRCLPGSYPAKLEKGAPIVGAKPLSLLREIVRDYSNPGDVVCDPCAGWGSTLLAAAELGRLAVGSERDDATFEAATRRIAEAA
jgi:site-specific DNA-methyltransferase (adenine-specific)